MPIRQHSICHSLFAVIVSLTVAPLALSAREPADTIYSGGPILTIDDDQPRAEAVAVRDGRIIAVGSVEDVMPHKGESTQRFDLAGRAMLPGFVDSHGHVVFGGLQAMSANLLAPPDGDVTDIASLQRVLRNWIETNRDAVESAGVVIGFGYDNAQLAEQRHPTRDELDAVSAELPIMIVHQSGHLGVANSKTLDIVGYDVNTKNPAGGVIQRDADGRPNGVLEEYAFFGTLLPVLQQLGPEAFDAFAVAGAKLWASYGYTTGQDGRSSEASVKTLDAMAADGKIPIDVVAYPDVLIARDFIGERVSRDYVNGIRVGGCKLTIDGSPQGFTALRDRPYYRPVGNYPEGYKGYAAVTEEQVSEAVDWCYENGVQIITHANGEGASDMLIAALEAAQSRYGDPDNRPALIHGQFLREEQVDAYKRLGVFMSLFPMHTFYWGDWHREHTAGPINGENISPTGWLMDRGMMFGSHHDAPVAFPNSMRILDATVTRRTRSGDILGPHHRVDVLTALKALTIWPAWQHFEEESKGSIEIGKRADFVMLSEDPTAVDPETLDELRVMATIKDDVLIYERDRLNTVSGLESSPFMNDPVTAHRFLHVMYQASGVEAPVRLPR